MDWSGPPRWHGRWGPGPPALPLWVTIVAVVGSVAAGRNHAEHRPIDAFAVALLVGAGLSLAGRRRYPLPVLGVTVGLTAIYYGLHYPYGPAFLALLVAATTAVLHGHRGPAWGILALGLVAFLAIHRASTGAWLDWRSTLGVLAWLFVGLALAELLRARSERFEEMRRSRQESVRRQASEERLRLAQDLHDVLAHNVSLINVQASTALHLMDDEPERARSALAAIKEASRETLQELRATVGALRAGDEPAPRRPTAGLANLDAMVAQSAAAGLRVEVRRSGRVRPLPPRVDLAAFRILQEALTNVRRHSGSPSAIIGLGYGERELELLVRDDGRGAAAQSRSDGHGLRGMRERAEALGGEFSAGTSASGGFEVVARLPLEGQL